MSVVSPIVVAVIAAVAAAGIGIGLLRRRRFRRHGPLSSALDPLPAGLKHLASSVSDLSGSGIRLPSARRDLVARHRLAVLLGLR